MIQKQLIEMQKYNEIAFLCIGEIGWEIKRWSGFWRKYQINHPEKKLIAVTRSDRVDLYSNCIKEIMSIDISEDYKKYVPNMYRLNLFPEEEYQKILQQIKDRYPNAYIFEAPNTNKRDLFSIEEMDFNYNPRIDNKSLIGKIIDYLDNKIPILISPRQRNDLSLLGNNVRMRNWEGKNWNKLFKFLEDDGRFLIFIAGKSPTYIRPKLNYTHFINIEDLLDTVLDVSLIGLTIEAIHASVVVIGQQSSIPILSNLMKTPTIMWGDEKYRHQILENPFGTHCEFFEEKTSDYCIDPLFIYEAIIKVVGL